MKLVIAGGTGFLGSPLAEVHAEEGHDVRVLTRSLKPGEARHESGTGVPGVTKVGWNPSSSDASSTAALTSLMAEADVVVNLAGASIGAGRWTPQRKAQLRDSRVIPTRAIATAITAAATPPKVLISASGVGYYGPAGAEPKTEDAPAGTDFLAHLCVDWETEARRAANAGTRVVLMRTGVVLERSGGALTRMLPPFRFFAGGPFGSGRQYMSWLHRLDYIEMVRWIIDTPAVEGPINATAPHPVTNKEFAKALGRAMRRPSLLPAPSAALKLLLGSERADALLLTGQRAIPAKALAHGYHFRYPEIDIAMRGIFGE
jgi:uncharacterized protein (TIGR01777 family)